MDLIVCGDFVSISCGTWLGFWSGAIGAFVAAFVGGLVALMVVRLTNGHQSKVAADARVVAAMSDFHAACSEMPRRYLDGREAIQQLVIQADAASNRITMDIDDFPLGEELSLWSLDLGVLALLAMELRRKGEAGRSDEAWKLLREVLGTLIGTTQQWARTPARNRTHWTSELRSRREIFKKNMEVLSGTTPPPAAGS